MHMPREIWPKCAGIVRGHVAQPDASFSVGDAESKLSMIGANETPRLPIDLRTPIGAPRVGDHQVTGAAVIEFQYDFVRSVPNLSHDPFHEIRSIVQRARILRLDHGCVG